MRVTRPTTSLRFGPLQVFAEATVLDPDAGGESSSSSRDDLSTSSTSNNSAAYFPWPVLDAVLCKMVIVVPCKDEKLSVIRGVLAAIPVGCAVILRGEDDNDEYAQQAAMALAFASPGRPVMAVHQKDPIAAAALRGAGMSELSVSGDTPTPETIRDGKGEGMILGIALAAAFCPGRKYIGFVDADNFRAASVTEYCKDFAAGFALSSERDQREREGDIDRDEERDVEEKEEKEETMVRLRWASKPKVRNGMVEFVPEGRCSRIVNSWLNRLFSLDGGSGSGRDGATETPAQSGFITTGNAGEHAMTMGLALKLRLASGYAIEPFHFVDLLERAQMTGRNTTNTSTKQQTPSSSSTASSSAPSIKPLTKPVRILQLRTRSPHYHRASPEAHIRRMWAVGLGCIYHGLASATAISHLLREMHNFAKDGGAVEAETGALPRPRVYPALEGMDGRKFREGMLGRKGRAGGTLRMAGL
ncbi:mannosyl-3-phosphoglycerate synthase [Chaetomium sp. MPI-SDFR-AT-0129]|nr:mannosyl-3-phosphoglycerate synthase [Chaetomium sp. MPI-SDFR-AT-0129]